MPTMLESRTEGFWIAPQEEGVPATEAVKQGRKVGGDIALQREDGKENYSDGRRFPDSQSFVNTLQGTGSPVLQAQAGITGFLADGITGGEEEVTQVGTSPNYDHVTAIGAGSRRFTCWKKVGDATFQRQRFTDALLSSLRIESQRNSQIVKVTPEFQVEGRIGEIYDTDPDVASDADDALLHTEGEGRYNIDGEVYRGLSTWALVIGDPKTPWYGDGIRPFAFALGMASVMLENLTLAVDEQGLTRYNEQYYGMAEPPAGTLPLETLPGLGSFAVDLRKGSAQRLAGSGTVSSGTFRVTIAGRQTADISFEATAAQVQAALETIVGRDRVSCSGGPLPGSAVECVFTDFQPAMVTDSANIGGGGTIAVTDHGYHRGLKIEVPHVQWAAPPSIAGNAEGGAVELALAASAEQPDPETDIVTITTRSGDSTVYALDEGS